MAFAPVPLVPTLQEFLSLKVLLDPTVGVPRQATARTSSGTAPLSSVERTCTWRTTSNRSSSNG